jgi:predicted Zn-dependent protease
VGQRIAQATGRTDYQWEFKVIEDAQVNAFCLPGGKVAVYTGILPVARDDAGLAAVLGHEIAHAIARHGGERVSQSLLVQTGLTATQAALASKDPGTVQAVASLLGAGASVGLLLPWDRAQESEADHLGLIYMAKAGYDPRAAVALWQRMDEASKGAFRVPRSSYPPTRCRLPGSGKSRPGSPRPWGTAGPGNLVSPHPMGRASPVSPTGCPTGPGKGFPKKIVRFSLTR